MSQKLLFIFNPHSGKGQIKNNLVEIIDTMVKADFEVTVYTTQAQGDAIQKVAAEAANYDRIVCSGGEGTLDEVMTGLIQSGKDVPIGYIPAGSTNDFANSLGIPKDMTKSAAVAVGDHPFPCDIGDFNSDTFVYVAAFGLFTEVSYKTSQQLKNIFGHVAYIMEGAKCLHDIPSYNMQVEYDGNVFQDEFIYGMVTNSISVGGFKGMTGNDVKLDDGVFEVNGSSLIVCQTSVIQKLQQDVEHIRMRLLDFIEQDDAVRFPSDRFRQLTAFIISNISRRRSDQS